MGKQELNYRTEVSPKEAAARLEELAAGLVKGIVCLKKSDQYVVLEPGYKVVLEIGGEHKKDKSKLSVEISWKMEEPVQAEDDLVIDSTPPPPEEETTEADEPGEEADQED